MPIIVHRSGKKKKVPQDWINKMQRHLITHGWTVQKEPKDVIKGNVPVKQESADPFINPEWNVKDTKQALEGLSVNALKRQLDIEQENKNRKSIVNEIKQKLGN